MDREIRELGLDRDDNELWHQVKQLRHILKSWQDDGENLPAGQLKKLMDACNVVWSAAAAAETRLQRRGFK